MWARASIIAFCLFSTGAAEQHRRLFPPNELHLVEGPDREIWQQPDRVMDSLAIGESMRVADIGAGSGWLTVRLAVRVGPNGRVYAEDLQPEMIASMRNRLLREGSTNVTLIQGSPTDPLLPAGLHSAIVLNSLGEFENPVELLKNVFKALRKGGTLGIIDFTKDGLGPGPPMNERVDKAFAIRVATDAGFVVDKDETYLKYQYFVIFRKK
jgi:ubiquinone/menaquinone biosynthesis C-methylase UbiE